MIVKCSLCDKEYDETDPEMFIFIENDVPMLCCPCDKKLKGIIDSA